MPYARDTSKLNLEPSQFAFPGDKQFGSEAYVSAMANTYLRKVPLATTIMERFRVPFDAEDKERVKRLVVTMGWLDHLLDEASDRDAALAVYKDLLEPLSTGKGLRVIPSWVRPELRTAIALLQNATRLLPTKYAQNVVAKALLIGDISVEKSACANVKEYAAILIEEGTLSSDLVIEFLGVAAHKSDGYSRLHLWNQKMVAAATLLDGAMDLGRDYTDSLTHVPPTVGNRLYLFW